MEPNTSAPQVPPVPPATSSGPVPVTPGFSPSLSPEPSNLGTSVPQPFPLAGAPVTPITPPARVAAEPIPSISVPSVEATSSTSSALPASGPRLAPLPPSAFAPRPITSPLTPPAGSPASVLQPTQTQPGISNPSSPTAGSAPSEVDVAKLDELKKRLEELKLQTGIAPAPMTPQANQAPSSTLSPSLSSTLAPQEIPTAQPAVPSTSTPAETAPSLPNQSLSPADVSASVTSPDALTMGPKLPSTEATPAKKHSSKTALLLILVIALLAVGGFVAYTILNRPSTPQQIINNEMPMQASDSMNPSMETSQEAINMEPAPIQDESSLAEPLPQDGYAEPTPTDTGIMGEVQGMMDAEPSIQTQE